MSRRLTTVVVASVGAIVAACDSVEPPTGLPRATAPALSSYSSSTITSSSSSGSSGSWSSTSSISSTSSGSGVSTTTVRVGPGTGVAIIMGDHKLKVPAGTICDPAKNGYGPSEWDKPCAVITQPLDITARSYTDADGHPRIDFSPALRFVPNPGGNVVTLHLMDKSAVGGGFSIYYCNDEGTCVDEGLTDPSLVTRTDARSGYLYRRLKHFSGYGVGVGRAEAEAF